VFRVQGKRGARWYAKYRLPDGHQVQKSLGPAWSERGRPPDGHFTKRTAQSWLRATLDQARAGTLPGMVRTGASFRDAAEEWLRYVEHDRGRKPSTLADYRSDDLVFVGELGGFPDGSALRRRFKRARDEAGLRPLRFHDLRHTFGSIAIRFADPREVQEWLGHADFTTTQIYMHYKPRADAARRLSAGFEGADGAVVSVELR
jgi:integrase